MRLPTFIRKARAERGGFFWLPCPNCGEMFGGNEVSKSMMMMSGPVDASNWCVCKWCAPRKTVFVRSECAGLGQPCPHDSVVIGPWRSLPDGWEGEGAGGVVVCRSCIEAVAA